MTTFPAQRMGLTDTGRIDEGYWADLVVFDQRTIGDGNWPRSDAQAAGIQGVVVSGEVVVRDGQLISGASPGRILRRGESAHCQPEHAASPR